MTELVLESMPAADIQFRSALISASLPVDDIEENGRQFFILRDGAGAVIGYSGLETCGDDVLLRSVVVLGERRGEGAGRTLTELTIARLATAAGIYLATMDAARFFRTIGFEAVSRADLPTAVLSTRQLSGLCPASATLMKTDQATDLTTERDND